MGIEAGIGRMAGKAVWMASLRRTLAVSEHCLDFAVGYGGRRLGRLGYYTSAECGDSGRERHGCW